MRRYEKESPSGTPVPFGTLKQRRALIGMRIEYNTRGWISKSGGVVQAVDGKNVMLDGDWRWAPEMLNVHVVGDA